MRSRSARVRRLAAWSVVVLVGGALALGVALDRGPREPRVRGTISVASALGGDDVEGFARAEAPRTFGFPRDHGPHPEFRTEWWYYTGNLRAADGRAFGFQLTFFRYALAPGPEAHGSEWRANDIYLAHFAVTDVARKRFRATARTSRAALGLAGARSAPFSVWLDGWSVEGAGSAGLPMRLRAAEGDVAIDLVLDSAKPVVPQGDHGLSRKSDAPGNASYYYSLTRMPARGTVRVGGEPVQVEGIAWMDREWSTSALGPALAGWDWFALQLDDGRDLMFYQLRRRDGSADPLSAGTLVERDGATHGIRRHDVALEVLATWRSPDSGVVYPARWRLTSAVGDLVVEITPRVAGQELIVGTRYWEGAVELHGTAHGRPVAGEGYVELVGYGEGA